MKSAVKSFCFLFIITLIPGLTQAQEDLRIPLTNPGASGKLIIHTVFADEVIVRTHDERDVRIVYDGAEKDRDHDNNKNGLRRISGGGAGLEVTEEDNEVEINSSPMPGDLELTVYVPKNFSLELNATQGDIEVRGLEGELEVSSVNGDIEITDISGSALVNSVNGDVTVEFTRVNPDVPMSFTGVNGDMEIILPANAKFTAKMKTEWGDVYTNFDMEVDRNKAETKVDDDESRYRVTLNTWIYGKVNGGGPEYLFKTLHGDISIRKR